LGEPPGPAKMP